MATRITVLRKKQNLGSPNGPPMIDSWVVRLSFGWSVNNILRTWIQLKNWSKRANRYSRFIQSTNRHIDGFVHDCSISSALEILQSCTKPWIWYQCICGVVCPLFYRNILVLQNIKNSLVAKRTIHGRTLGRPLDSWVAFSNQATIFQQHWDN